jgi:alkaline phosphatase
MKQTRWVGLIGASALALGMGKTPPHPDAAESWRTQGEAAVEAARALAVSEHPARNVILFIGDGMGVSTVTAARILEGQLRGGSGEEHQLAFERLPHVALMKTYNTNQQVPDSAGTATAMLTGVKTRAGVLGLDATAPLGVAGQPEQRLRTLFEEAETRGLATGLVTTTRITHATPAAAYAHTPHRDWECDADVPAEAAAAGERDIALQLVEMATGDGIDVVLGGGRAQFLPAESTDPEYPEQRGARADRRDLVAEWRAARPGRATLWKRDQLVGAEVQSARQVLGLFEPSHMQFDAQRPGDAAGEPSLAEMTALAIERLAKHEPGFVLLVEGGRIDHGHHAGSAFLALYDAIAFSAAVDAALERVDPEDTLVVVTADHSHVFTVGGYPKRGNPILGLVRGNDERGDPSDEPMRDASGLPYTTVGYANGPGHPGASDSQPEGPKRLPHIPSEVKGVTQGRPDLSEVDTTDPRYLQESAVPLELETHAGEDVPVYAGGPGAQLFHGVQEQSYVYHAITAALGW